MVQRLARGPFKAEIRVRFPLALPAFEVPSARSHESAFLLITERSGSGENRREGDSQIRVQKAVAELL